MIEMYNKIEAVKEQVEALRDDLGGMYSPALKQALGLALHELNHASAIIQHNINQECA